MVPTRNGARPGDVAVALVVGLIAALLVAVALSVLLGLEWSCDPDTSHCDEPPEGAATPLLLGYFGVFITGTALALRWLLRR